MTSMAVILCLFRSGSVDLWLTAVLVDVGLLRESLELPGPMNFLTSTQYLSSRRQYVSLEAINVMVRQRELA
jgi:hypothetical protein